MINTDGAMMNNMPTGWRCPRCNKINGPHVNSCDCVSTQQYGSTQYIPFPVYPTPIMPYSPPWPWDYTVTISDCIQTQTGVYQTIPLSTAGYKYA